MIISALELVVYTPLCLFWYRSIMCRSPMRHALNLLVSSIQLFGTIMFAGSEVYNGFPNVPVDSSFSFTPHHLLYFWLVFVVANLLWIIVPFLCIIDGLLGVEELGVQHTIAAARNHNRGSKKTASRKVSFVDLGLEDGTSSEEQSEDSLRWRRTRNPSDEEESEDHDRGAEYDDDEDGDDGEDKEEKHVILSLNEIRRRLLHGRQRSPRTTPGPLDESPPASSPPVVEDESSP